MSNGISSEQLNSESTAVRLTDTPLVQTYKANQSVFFGRNKIYTSITSKELTAEKILEILPEIMRQHEINAREIDYLYNYYKGNQPILGKTKSVRADINNVVLENHAFEIVEFKKSSEFGEPVQYVQKGETNLETISKEISLLNKFMESEDKSTLDNELAEWQYICGTAYRWCDIDTREEEDEAPFEMSVPDPRRTFVVYSNGIKEKQLLSGFYSYFSDRVMTTEGKEFIQKNRIITIYTDDKYFEFKEYQGNYSIIEQKISLNGEEIQQSYYPLLTTGQRIIEYPLNQARLGFIELVITQLNAINRIKSDDLDAIDQYVQSLLVFVNQDIDTEKFKELIKLGAVQIASENKDLPADLKLLTQQLMHDQTKIVTDDLYDKALTILGMPKNSAKASGGDTGQARELGEGWELSYQRAKQDDLMFKKSERQFLKLILKICKAKSIKESNISELKISDIDIKIPRNKADNLLVKAQALVMLLQAGVHPEVAFTVVGLFGDPHDVYTKSSNFQGEDFWKKVQEFVNAKANENPKTNDQKSDPKNKKSTLSDEGNNQTH